MLNIKKRKISKQELQQLKSLEPKFWDKFERFILLLMASTFVLLMPFLWYDKKYPVPPSTELIILIPLLILATLTAFYIYRWIDQQEGPHSSVSRNLIVEEWHIQTQRVIHREDIEDFGPAYYFQVTHEGQQRWLFLWGQYFYDYNEEYSFPNTAFTIVRRADHKTVFSIQVYGQALAVEKSLPPFPKKAWRAGKTEEDGDLLVEIPDWSSQK
ncbi:MAG: hypothetical protein KTR30_17270 [Saprospiraceae bacterium]|nr:hypothetical protein [Saprospiraceae bacterium]